MLKYQNRFIILYICKLFIISNIENTKSLTIKNLIILIYK